MGFCGKERGLVVADSIAHLRSSSGVVWPQFPACPGKYRVALVIPFPKKGLDVALSGILS